jgi:hypothetical protein
MNGIITLLLIAMPLLFQIIFGRKAIGEDIKLKFGAICLISGIGQLLFSYISLLLLSNRLEEYGQKCGLPLVGLIMISLFFTACLIITMIVQYFIKRSYVRR